ncbi:MAG: hypothetical protein ACI959_001252 [Limisphaerales bacterium]|jgi:hypothetical protein
MLTAQVVINEYSASNLESFQDAFGKTEDWIELYNAGSTSVNLSGWHLSDKQDKPTKWVIPAGTNIPADGFLTFWCSGRDLEISGEYHTSFKLAQTTGDDVVLLADPSGSVINIFPLDLTLTEHSRCRITDGSNDWAICIDPSPGNSNNGQAQYSEYTARPSMDLDAGYYSGLQIVSIQNNEPNSVLRYTVNGSNPTSSSPEYTSPISISETIVIKAKAFSNNADVLEGKIEFNTYFINEDFSLPVFSVAADQVINLANGNGDLIPVGSIEYFNLNKEREATSFGSLNRHGQDSWVLPHRSLDWISRDEMGYSKAVNAPLFNYSDRDEYQKFMFRNSGDDNYPANNDADHVGSTHIRDEYVQVLAMNGEMELDQRAVERVILFLNGEYWGLYGMRERAVDHDYTDEYYKQGKYELQYLTTWGTTEIQYGGSTALNQWEDLRDFILDNDMSDPANYKIADDSINLLSLVDYMIVNLSVVASDWLNYNTGWWRGLDKDKPHTKWGYILWDLDATFDYYINYSGVPNISPDADPCDIEDIADYMDEFFAFSGYGYGTSTLPEDCPTILDGSSPYPPDDSLFMLVIQADGYCCDVDWDDICQETYDQFASSVTGEIDGNVGKHEKIFLRLLEQNETFRQLYYSRYADMNNTVYNCENMIYTLDSMLATIEPEMPKQIERWGGTMMEWQDNVEELKDFINQRCELITEGILDCYDELSGPYQLTLMAEPEGIGEIDLNTLDIESFPWSGYYFGGMENKIKARVFDQFETLYEFSHWESTSGSLITPDLLTRKAAIYLEGNDTLTAVFNKLRAGGLAVSLYPNPASNQVNLQYSVDSETEVVIRLFNITGQRVAEFPQAGGLRSPGVQTETLDLSKIGLATGLYLLEIKTEGQQITMKLDIMR